MKKLFTLLTMLIVAISTSWATETTVVFKSSTKDDSGTNLANLSSGGSVMVGNGLSKFIATNTNSLSTTANKYGYRADRANIVFKFDGTTTLSIQHNANSTGSRMMQLYSFSSDKALKDITSSDWSTKTIQSFESTNTTTTWEGGQTSVVTTNTEKTTWNYTTKGCLTVTWKDLPAGYYVLIGSGSEAYIYSFTADVNSTTYTVTYKANNGTEESDVVDNAATKAAANTFTAPSGKAFSGWNTSADGTGDAYAVNDAISTDNLVLFAQWVNAYTQFSMTNITGPTEQVASQDKAPVTATFSTGGSAEVFNAHGSSPATMVLSNTIFLTSSGNSYCHVSFPSKLQAGDVIALGETTGNAYLATTSSKPNSKVAIPYTIPANSSLIGATDLYIFNNKDDGDAEKIASFSEFTITGAGTASDLIVTSATSVNINVGGTSTIGTSSSSTGAITFASSDVSVATVSDEGVITAVNGGTATITISQDVDETYRAGATKVTVTVIETALVKARLTGSTTANMTGSMSATYSGKTQNVDSQVGGCKLGSQENWTGFTLNGDNTLKTGDIVEVKISQRNGSTPFVFYDSKEETNTLLTTTVGPDPGVYRFVLPEAANGKKGVFLVRGKENSEVTGHENTGFNPHVVYIALYRPDATITLNAKGYATYSKATDFEFLGAKAYKMALNESAKTITGTEVTGKIAAGEGILFKGEAGATVSITETTGAEALTGNNLKGTTTASGKATVPTYCYTLSGDTFKKFKGAEFNDNKAYLESTQDLSGQSLEIIFDDQPTAINFVVEDDANVVAAPVKTIKNGQLFIGNYNVAGQQVK